MERGEMDWAVEMAAREGWNPGLHDAEAFYAADPKGFLVGTLHDDPIGCISAVAYGDTFGFVGLYVVSPEHRGQGHGFRLWKAALERLKGRNVGLDGVVEQQANYRRSGFNLAYRNVRYRFDGPAEVPQGIIPIDADWAEALAAYEKRLFPASRTEFLRNWLAVPDASSFAVVEDDRLLGWGAIRPCREGHKIGPLFAESTEIADRLFQALASTRLLGNVYLDVPEPNTAAVALAERHRMTRVFETARMYTGPEPEMDLHRIFGVTSFELG
jgi:GNAT superfamily N-acetyltransferase